MKRIAILCIVVSVIICGCGSSSAKSSEKSEKKAPPIEVIDADKETDDYVRDEPAAPEASSDMDTLDQLYDYVNSSAFEEDITNFEIPDELDVPVTDDMTLSQQNAVKTAMNYIDLMAFSKRGLIEQMSSDYGDRFPKADA